MMAHWICELFTFVPAFLYVAAGLEGKTWTETKKKKGGSTRAQGKWGKTVMRKRNK